jgi:photosystem II stability/assembly factor-like uncharacterized protein
MNNHRSFLSHPSFIFLLLILFNSSSFAQKKKWKPLGPFRTPNEAGGANATGIGRVSCITFHPDYGKKNSTIYAGAPTGGLYISKDNAAHWSKVNTNLHLEGISNIEFDYNDKNTIYLGTGDKDGIPNIFQPEGATEFSQSIGIAISRDGGKTWHDDHANWNNDSAFWKYPSHKNISSIISTPGGTLCSVYEMDQKNSNFDSYVFKTTDKGRSYTLCMFTDSIMIREMAALPSKPSTVFAAGEKAYFSEYNGEPGTWVTVQLGNQRYSRIELATGKGTPDVVYLLAAVKGTGTVELYSCDGHGNAKLLRTTPNIFSGEARFTYTLEAMNTSKDIYFGNLPIYKTDSTFKFKAVSNWHSTPGSATFVHADVHAMRAAPDSNVIYAGHDGGISRSRNSGATWENITEGLDIAKVYRISCSQNSKDILAGTQDAGTMLYDEDGSENNHWYTLRGGDGGECFISYSNDSMMVHSDGQNNIMAITMDHGKTWRSIMPPGERGEFLKPVIQDPKEPNTIYIGLHDVYRSADAGKSWNRISDFKVDKDLKLSTLEVNSMDPKIIYAGYIGPTWGGDEKGILFRTLDGGQTWEDVTEGLHAVKYTLLKAVETAAMKPLTVFAGFGQSWVFKVMRSDDGGKTWIDFSEGLTVEDGVNDLICYNNTLYAATHTGVFIRSLNGGSWKKFSKGLPNVPVYNLDISAKYNLLRAATCGRGVWECIIKP